MVQMASKRAVRGEGVGGERGEGCGEGVERRVGRGWRRQRGEGGGGGESGEEEVSLKFSGVQVGWPESP